MPGLKHGENQMKSWVRQSRLATTAGYSGELKYEYSER
jgi:hypothetical protein